MLTLHAQPYDINAAGFYFQSFDEWEEKFAAADERGVEEFEIQYIDGDDEQTTFAQLMEPTQANIEDWFDGLDEWETMNEMEQASLAWLIEDRGMSFREAQDELTTGEEPALFEGSVRDYAEEFIDDCYNLEESMGDLSRYFDYDAFVRDLELSGDVATFEFNGKHYVVTNACCL